MVDPSGDVQDAVDRSFALLSAQELRILVLSADGVDLDALADQLGIDRATVAVHRMSLREKLGIPPFEALPRFIARTPRLAFLLDGPAGAASSGPAKRGHSPERRDQHLLRLAVDDFAVLEAGLRTKADAVGELMDIAGPEQRWTLAGERSTLLELADEVQALAGDAIARMRRGGDGVAQSA